jgi:DNA repair exonuclease SbcCD nuclease subunit
MNTVLFIGDIHIKFGNLKDLEKLKNVMLQMKDISFIVVAGDLLDTHEKIHSQLMNYAYEFIKSLRTIADVYVLVGNHDYINNQQFLTTNHWMNGMKEWNRVYVVDYPLFIENKYLLVPYVPPGRFVEALNKINNWKNADCIFAHQEIKNCKMGCIKSIDGDEWDVTWPMLISGHIHERQQIGLNVLYPGSALNHAFGSDNQGISKFIFTEGTMKEETIDINLDKKSIIYENVTNIENIPSEKLIVQNKLCLSGEQKDIQSFKKSQQYNNLITAGIKVTFKLTKMEKNTTESAVPYLVILNELIAKENDRDLEKDFFKIKV